MALRHARTLSLSLSPPLHHLCLQYSKVCLKLKSQEVTFLHCHQYLSQNAFDRVGVTGFGGSKDLKLSPTVLMGTLALELGSQAS